MPMHPYIRAYLCSVGYAALFLFSLHGPKFLVTSLLQLIACIGLIVLLLMVVVYHDEIRKIVIRIFEACALLLSCLLPVIRTFRLPAELPRPINESFRTTLFQRPPPRCA